MSLRKRVAGRFVREDVAPTTMEPLTEAKKRKRSLQPRHCQTYTRKRVAEALPEIVERFVEEAKKGSIPHAKILTVLSGLDKGGVTGSPERRRESLAAVLMKELKKEPGQQS